MHNGSDNNGALPWSGKGRKRRKVAIAYAQAASSSHHPFYASNLAPPPPLITNLNYDILCLCAIAAGWPTSWRLNWFCSRLLTCRLLSMPLRSTFMPPAVQSGPSASSKCSPHDHKLLASSLAMIKLFELLEAATASGLINSRWQDGWPVSGNDTASTRCYYTGWSACIRPIGVDWEARRPVWPSWRARWRLAFVDVGGGGIESASFKSNFFLAQRANFKIRKLGRRI